MIRALHAGLGRVRLALAHIRASVGRPFKTLYLRPIIFTTNPERVNKSAYWWGLVERQGTVIMRKGLRCAPRSWRRRARIGKFLASKLGLQASEFKWREQVKIEQDKWALSLKAIVYSWLHPRVTEQGTYIPKGPGPERPWSTQNPPPRISRAAMDDEGNPIPSVTLYGHDEAPTKPPGHVTAVDAAWAEMTPAQRRSASRRASKLNQIVV